MFSTLSPAAAMIRDAREEDANKICEVLIRSVREVCAADYNNDEAVLENWCSNKRPDVVSDWVRDPDKFLIVSELPPHGIVGVAMYARSEAAVHLCYLVPEGLHQGFGTALLQALEAEAARLKHSRISLISSITARDFYKRNGYVENGEPRFWGKVLAYPMSKTLAQ